MANPITDAIKSLTGMAQGAKALDGKNDPGPGDVGPTTQSKKGGGLVTLQMPEADVAEWWKRVERAKDRVKAREEKWDILLNEYLPIVTKSGEPETVKVQGHFRNVHSKIGQLFYRSPDLVLAPRDVSPAQNEMPNPMNAMLPPGMPPMPPLKMEDIISVKQSVLTLKLGRDGIKVNRLMDELLFDVLAWAGFGAAKLGYRCVIKQVAQPKMMPAPVMSQPGSVLGLGASAPASPPQMVPATDEMGQPVMENVPVPIFEEWYMRRFSPKKALWNDDLKSSRYDEDATWMGMDFYMSPKRAMKEFQLTEEEVSKATDDDRVHKYDDDSKGDKTPGLVHGIEIWCKASVFTDELHPQAINQLVLIEGVRDKPVVWRPSPDQEFDQMGKLTPDSLIGFPIRILTIRDLADSAFPQSDSAFTNSEIKQLSTWRRQSIRIRDAALGKYFYDMGAFDEAEIEILKNGEVGSYIGVEAGKLQNGADKVFATSAQIHATQDDYRGAEAIKRDIDETLGISSVQAGAPEPTVRSATETSTVQQAVTARNDKELGRVIDFYLDAARMIDQLLMRYADQNEYIEIGGEAGAKRLMVWNNKVISGKYLYDIAPDSQLRVDTAKDFQLDLNFYNQAAKDPLFNRSYWLRKLARARGADPSKALIPQEALPKPQPEKPKVTISLSGEDFLNPQIVLMLERLGMLQPPPPPQQGGQPDHGGANTAGETISQHAASNSGARPNEPGSENHRQSQVK